MTISVTPQAIIDFWYTPPMSNHWFDSTPEIDQTIVDQFKIT